MLENEGIVIPFIGNGHLIYDMDLIRQADDFHVVMRSFNHGPSLIRWTLTITSFSDHETTQNQTGTHTNIHYNVNVSTELKYIYQKDLQLLLPEDIVNEGFIELRKSETPNIQTNIPLYEFDKYFTTRCVGNNCSTNLTDSDNLMTMENADIKLTNLQRVTTKFDVRTIEEPLISTNIRSFSLSIQNTLNVYSENTGNVDGIEFCASCKHSGSSCIYTSSLITVILMCLINI